MKSQDIIWKALADPTRREILDILSKGPLTTGELSNCFQNLSRFAIMKHMGILQRANFITIRRKGKFRWNHLNTIPLQEIYERWVSKYEEKWSTKLIQLKKYAEINSKTMKQQKNGLSTTRVAIEITINASLEVVWNTLFEDINNWWRKDFYTSSRTRNFVLERKIGGLMYEDYGNGEGLVWAEIIGIDSPNTLELRGNLTAAFGGPAISFLKIELESSNGSTILKLTDDIFGHISENIKNSLTEGWHLLFNEGLKKYVEENPGPLV